jgi:hypothetical protein
VRIIGVDLGRISEARFTVDKPAPGVDHISLLSPGELSANSGEVVLCELYEPSAEGRIPRTRLLALNGGTGEELFAISLDIARPYGGPLIPIPDQNADGVMDFMIGESYRSRVHLLSGSNGLQLGTIAGPPIGDFGVSLAHSDGLQLGDWACVLIGDVKTAGYGDSGGRVSAFSLHSQTILATWGGEAGITLR